MCSVTALHESLVALEIRSLDLTHLQCDAGRSSPAGYFTVHHCVGPLQLPMAGSCTCSFIQLVMCLHTDERMHDHMLKNQSALQYAFCSAVMSR